MRKLRSLGVLFVLIFSGLLALSTDNARAGPTLAFLSEPTLTADLDHIVLYSIVI